MRQVAVGEGDQGTVRRQGSHSGGAYHVLDGADGGDGILGEREGHGHGAGQLAVDVDRAAAHSFHDAGMFQGTAGKPCQDERLFGSDVVEHPENLHLEFVHPVAGEDRAANAAHAGPDVLQRKERTLGGKDGRERKETRKYQAAHNLIVPTAFRGESGRLRPLPCRKLTLAVLPWRAERQGAARNPGAVHVRRSGCDRGYKRVRHGGWTSRTSALSTIWTRKIRWARTTRRSGGRDDRLPAAGTAAPVLRRRIRYPCNFCDNCERASGGIAVDPNVGTWREVV